MGGPLEAVSSPVPLYVEKCVPEQTFEQFPQSGWSCFCQKVVRRVRSPICPLRRRCGPSVLTSLLTVSLSHLPKLRVLGDDRDQPLPTPSPAPFETAVDDSPHPLSVP